jgi:hypothetical protein
MHAFLEVHDTPLSAVLAAPAGRGIGKISQPEPLQRSASITWTLALLV